MGSSVACAALASGVSSPRTGSAALRARHEVGAVDAPVGFQRGRVRRGGVPPGEHPPVGSREGQLLVAQILRLQLGIERDPVAHERHRARFRVRRGPQQFLRRRRRGWRGVGVPDEEEDGVRVGDGCGRRAAREGEDGDAAHESARRRRWRRWCGRRRTRRERRRRCSARVTVMIASGRRAGRRDPIETMRARSGRPAPSRDARQDEGMIRFGIVGTQFHLRALRGGGAHCR